MENKLIEAAISGIERYEDYQLIDAEESQQLVENKSLKGTKVGTQIQMYENGLERIIPLSALVLSSERRAELLRDGGEEMFFLLQNAESCIKKDLKKTYDLSRIKRNRSDTRLEASVQEFSEEMNPPNDANNDDDIFLKMVFSASVQEFSEEMNPPNDANNDDDIFLKTVSSASVQEFSEEMNPPNDAHNDDDIFLNDEGGNSGDEGGGGGDDGGGVNGVADEAQPRYFQYYNGTDHDLDLEVYPNAQLGFYWQDYVSGYTYVDYQRKHSEYLECEKHYCYSHDNANYVCYDIPGRIDGEIDLIRYHVGKLESGIKINEIACPPYWPHHMVIDETGEPDFGWDIDSPVPWYTQLEIRWEREAEHERLRAQEREEIQRQEREERERERERAREERQAREEREGQPAAELEFDFGFDRPPPRVYRFHPRRRGQPPPPPPPAAQAPQQPPPPPPPEE
ncbi:hypothetical protein ACP275_04G043800 [Erythranthe tilingii]